MAAANPIQPFVWGAGGSVKTPEQVAREREIAAALMQEGMDYSPVGHWLAGAARAAQGGVGALKDRWAGEAETAGREGFQSRWDSVFGGGAAPVQTAALDPVAAALTGTPQTATDATAMMSGGASPSTPSPISGDWLEYANQGATRNQPLAPELVSAMGFLPEMGVTMRVVSGGQDSEGPNRVGSTRHDHGNSGDVDFYQNGRKLDWNNQNDLPILSNIVSRARSNGVTGIGAGDDYMGAGRFHIGFGNEAVWGAGGKSENAPEWLRAAYNGAAVPTGGGSQSPLQMAQAPDMAALLGLASDPWANDAQRSIVESLMGQQMQQQDPRYQQQLAMGDLDMQRARVELEQLLNPAPAAPDYGFMTMPDGTLVRTDSTSGSINPLGQFAPEPEPGFTILPPEQAAANGLDPAKAWQVGPDNRIYEVGGGGVNVSVGGPSQTPGDDKFYETLGTESGKRFSAMIEQGSLARKNLTRLDVASDLLETAPQGPMGVATLLAGRVGVDLGGLNETQALNAVIEQMVPSQREPGSGPMSDKDIEMYRGSVVSLSNMPGGNKLIIDTARAINEYDVKIADIAGQVEDGVLTRAQARAEMAKVPNPIDAFREARDRIEEGGGAQGSPAAPAPGQSQAPAITSQEQYDALPSGSPYKAPDGSIRTKR